MSSQPIVTVLLAVYNDARFLPLAVQSVLLQTFEHFDFVVINDGSTDDSGEYLAQLHDPRLRIFHNDSNLGLAASLNRGLDLSRGGYIARMDADDICEPDRLRRQVEFLDANSQVGVLGSSRKLIDEEGKPVAIAAAVRTDLAIRWKCLLGNPFAHPTVMLRRSVLDEHRLRYALYQRAQDYEFWTRVLLYTQGANLPDALVQYRLRGGDRRAGKAMQLANHDRIAHAACSRLLPQFPLTVEQVRNLRGRYGGFSVREPEMDPQEAPWLDLYRQMFEEFMESRLHGAKREPGHSRSTIA
ncbi:MAG TPA: glycosyltransferase family 2 protein [Tepidisphaeraceae bacterium]|jgi:glycosyltransferase involved in cell wall biosynthesis|nr:glycosyltransferase family 2 protein [Tepidisphaeraceae bacterium]